MELLFYCDPICPSLSYHRLTPWMPTALILFPRRCKSLLSLASVCITTERKRLSLLGHQIYAYFPFQLFYSYSLPLSPPQFERTLFPPSIIAFRVKNLGSVFRFSSSILQKLWLRRGGETGLCGSSCVAEGKWQPWPRFLLQKIPSEIYLFRKKQKNKTWKHHPQRLDSCWGRKTGYENGRDSPSACS